MKMRITSPRGLNIEVEGTPIEVSEFAALVEGNEMLGQAGDQMVSKANYPTTDEGSQAMEGVPLPQVVAKGEMIPMEEPRVDPNGLVSAGVGERGIIGESAHLHDIPIESKAVDAAAIKRSTIPQAIADSLELVRAEEALVSPQVRTSMKEGRLCLDATTELVRITGKPFVDDVPEADSYPMTEPTT